MIMLLKEGLYQLVETKGQTKILMLDKSKAYAWVNVLDFGEILVSSHRAHKTNNVLAVGKFRLYDVKDEPKLTDLQHLELLVGDGKWQGYLLPTGIPTTKNTKKRIIPTKELITKTIH